MPGVAVRAADLEAAGRVDVVDGLVAEQLGRHDLRDHVLHIGVELGLLLAAVVARLVLGGDDDGGGLGRLALFEAQA